MTIDNATVEKIANLARISVPAAEVPALAQQLSNILKLADELKAVDTVGVTPMTTAVKMKLPYRKDVVNDGRQAEALLANAPDKQGEFFAVPKVIE